MLNKQKKYLGQHFLKNKKILEEMARSAEVSKQDIVLEVGPGLGSLTEILVERAGKIIAVEKDRDLIPYLQEKFRNQKNIKIIQGDILKLPSLRRRGLGEVNYKIVANIPYYITSRFLRIFLSNSKVRLKLMVLMVQKEVAERICAKPPKMNLLALSVQAYAKPEIIRRVPKNFFSPPPKVDSAILKLSLFTSTPPLLLKDGTQEKILSVARIAFQQKRKMLRHSLKNKLSTSDVDRFGNKRPEELALEDWVKIVVK